MSPDRLPGLLDRLDRGGSARATLTGGARMVVDHVVPFLFVEHMGPGRPRPSGALAGGEASILLVPGGTPHPEARGLVDGYARELSSRFGHVLLVEVWVGPPDPGLVPTFRIGSDRTEAATSAATVLARQLGRIEVAGRRAVVTREPGAIAPKGGAIVRHGARRPWATLQVEVGPCFADPETGGVDLAMWRRLRRQLVLALRRTSYEFTRAETRWAPPHVHALGRRSLPSLARKVDAALAAVQHEVDVLFAVTPTDAHQMRREFSRSRRERPPRFRYPALTADTDDLKRQLAAVPVDDVDDPALAHIFREKRREIDLQLSLVDHRGRPQFLGLSAALHGTVDTAAAEEAANLLDKLPPAHKREHEVDARGFAAAAEVALAEMGAEVPPVVLRPGLTSLLVSKGQLHVGSSMTFPATRVEALIAHEVGTHVVTWVNGRRQPLVLLAVGLPGYDEAQEGLAVLAEHLVGGLDRRRLRTLAGRVVAARTVQDGADFVETYRTLRDLRFRDEPAFTMTMRVHRGGGLLKDAVYLRGLKRVVAAISAGMSLPSLLLGKLSLEYVDLVEELVRRQILRGPEVLPPWLAEPGPAARLADLRQRRPELVELVSERPELLLDAGHDIP